MSDIDAIRRRLDAIAGFDLSNVERETEIEYYGDWIKLGPVLLQDFDPEDEFPHWRESERENKRQLEALVEFLSHAAEDIRVLLDQCQP
jgi:hypothetical protein